MAVNQAIARLKNLEPKLASTVECRYFGGYTEKETVDALGVNVSTIRRYWKRAKQRLKLELNS